MRSVICSADRIAVAVLVILAVIVAITFRDYGLGWDDYTHSQYGDLLLKLYGSGFADTRALSFVNLYKYGGGFDMAAALAAKMLPFGLFETRRLIGAAVGILGLFVTWRIGRRIGGPLGGLSALVLLAACPLYYGHMFMNAKDAPFATAMAVLLLGLVRAFDEYPKPDARTVVLAGVGLGLAFGSRVLAGIAAPCGLAALLFLAVTESRAAGWKQAAQRCGQFLWTLLPALALGYLIMGLLWPWSVRSPLNPLYAAEYFDTFFERPWDELYEGRLIPVPNMPASYLPHLFMLTLPEIMLALGLIGTIGAFIAAARGSVPLNRRATLMFVALAAIFPVALAMAVRPALYNGLRHFIFVVPPFAALGGLAIDWLAESARRAWQGRARRDYRRLHRRHRPAGERHGAAASLRIHVLQRAFRRRAGGAARLHARLLGPRLQTGGRRIARTARSRQRASAARAALGGGDLRSAVFGAGGTGAAIRNHLRQQDRRLRHVARHVLLPAPDGTDPGQRGARGRAVYARVYDMRGGQPQKLLTQPPP